MESLERLQGLYADLVAFSETRLTHIERLWHELEHSLQEFRSLLDKPQPATQDKDAFNNRKITVNGQEYGVNDEFKHLSAAVGVVLDIDEVEAGRLLVETQTSGETADEQSIIADVVNKFHDRRDLLLQCLRLTIEQSQNLEHDPLLKAQFEDVVAHILDVKDGPSSNGSAFAQKCLKSMQNIEAWQIKVNEQIQSKAILSQARGKAFYDTFEFQRASLFKQHEALGAILAHLFRGNYTISEDLRKLSDISKRWQRLEFQYTHYLPAYSAAFKQYGAPEGSTTPQIAKTLHAAIPASENAAASSSTSLLRPFIAVLDMWWTAEYSGFSRDVIQDRESTREADERAKIIKRALNDSGLEAMLSICATVNSDLWRQPARHELITILLDGSSLSWEGVEQASSYFTAMLMDCFESFAEAWITNMPDSIRKLKSDEDDQRLAQLMTLQEGLLPRPQRDQGLRMHLEAFLVLIAFSVEEKPEAAEQFWADPDGNLYGFLQWSSRRQTVPRVSAFCEMICALSKTPDTADSAHKFLLDESIIPQTTRGRRMPTMNYQQIFAEIEFYARKVHEKIPAPPGPKTGPNIDPDFNETESPIMLSSYLRLLGHLCRYSGSTRFYMLGESALDLPKTLLAMSSGPIPSYLRASIFNTLEAFLTDKESTVTDRIWTTIDEWASTAHDRATITSQQASSSTIAALQGSLSAIASSHDQSDAFVKLLRTLIWPLPEASGQPLPFPPELGSTYRTPGIGPYVDFVCTQINPKRIREWSEESNGQGLLRCYHCLDFIIAGLQGFNENYVTKLGNSPAQLGRDADYATMYGQRHPFTRIMQWIFSIDLNKALMLLLQERIESVISATPGSPLLNNLEHALTIVMMVIDLQPTFFDVIRPKLKTTETQKVVPYSGFTAIEESIVTNPSIILNLCQYGASPHIPVVLKSLALLQKLTSSPRLQHYSADEKLRRGKSRRLIDILGTTGEQELNSVSQILNHHFNIDERELESGFEAEGYLIKDGALAFFNACLSTNADSVNLAHLLLGFRRLGERLAISHQIENGVSVFDSIIRLACEYPDAQDGTLLSWLVHLKSAAMNVLRRSWSSRISSDLTFNQLRRTRFMLAELTTQTVVSQASLWDGLSILHDTFWRSTSAEGFAEFLSYRGALYDYVARELRLVATERQQSLQQLYLSALLGKSTETDGSITNNPTIFDLFDFAELDTDANMAMAELNFFRDIDLEAYRIEATEDLPELYDLRGIAAVLNRSYVHICQELAQVNKPADEEELTSELDYVLAMLESRNRYKVAQQSRIKSLHSYVDMVVSAIECCPMEVNAKSQFILRMLQLILPKMDVYMVDGALEAIELARAADALLHALSGDAQSTTQSRVESMVTEKLFQLFRICVEGIPKSTTSAELRSLLYSICSEYLARILTSTAAASESHQKARSNSMDCVRSTGAQLISILSDDAEDGLDSCRLSALNLLAQLVSLARSEKSSFLLDGLVKANTLEVLLEPVKEVAAEFQATGPLNRPYLITVFEARMMFFLQISRTRSGASALLDTGLMPSLRDSMIFAADPDLGMDLDSTAPTISVTDDPKSSSSRQQQGEDAVTSALHNYFLLLSATLRVLLSTFASIGPQNEKIVYLVRTFLADYRANLVGVFKKARGVNGRVSDPQSRRALEECVRCYTGLAVGCGFMDFEDETVVERMNDPIGNGVANGLGGSNGHNKTFLPNGGKGFT